ncbi:ferritin-like domain-containing protein [Fictibacillus nanhaiensis]|uniref:ferritin-like domain-containing protein n=1 Tax=Fictibacillus nanhaiensis TaxID=742169 RepID=UPI001C941D05|nr:ferritin-like domain-containing protein [Fictibacillus nanhaiensis]MBY6038189.1 ferritin-like domain-containing protein [Fictibacillus nanhaiensis]
MSYHYRDAQQAPSGSQMNYEQHALLQSLRLIREAIQGEKDDARFYEYLISVASTNEEKLIIASIRNDEKKHNQLFKQIYKDITHQDVPATNGAAFEKPDSYVDGITKALFGELKAVEKYREIRKGLPNTYYRDILFDIITDEMKHSAKYNYLYTLNQSRAHETDDGVQATSTPDQWVMYIDPLVKRALKESQEGINLTHLFQEFILSGVLVGQGYTPDEAIELVEGWEKTGESKLLKKSKMPGKPQR